MRLWKIMFSFLFETRFFEFFNEEDTYVSGSGMGAMV